jgi:hypothetical protein
LEFIGDTSFEGSLLGIIIIPENSHEALEPRVIEAEVSITVGEFIKLTRGDTIQVCITQHDFLDIIRALVLARLTLSA